MADNIEDIPVLKDDLGNLVNIGDKVVVSGDKYFYKRYVVDVKPSKASWYGATKVAISETPDGKTKRWTYAHRILKYDW